MHLSGWPPFCWALAVQSRAVRFDGHKLIETLSKVVSPGKGMAQSTRGDTFEMELFNSQEDPAELNNIADSSRDLFERMREALDARLSVYREDAARFGIQNHEAPALTESERERMEAVGYLQ